MKKIGLLNQPLSNVVAGMGHMDSLVIADAGLPIPPNTQRIDLAVSRNIPRFIDVLQAVLSELQVQSAVISQEIASNCPHMHSVLIQTLGNVPVKMVPYEDFKQRTTLACAVVRTGEFTPYANIILIAGLVF